MFNSKAAVFATILMFVSPTLLHYSHQLRMYSLISVLSLWIFYFTERVRMEGMHGKNVKLLVILELALSYCHAIGIVFVFFHYVYGLFSNTSHDRKKHLTHWTLLHAVVFIMSIPVILNSLFKAAEHATHPKFNDIIELISSLNISIPSIDSWYSLIASACVILSLLALKKTRLLVFCYMVCPIFLFILLSYTIKPVWLSRNFIFAMPIIIVAQSLALAYLYNTFKKYRIVLFLSVALISTGHLPAYLQSAVKNDSSFSDLSFYLKSVSANNSKTCIVSTNHLNAFWSLLRYNAAVDWGNPLLIQPPKSERWEQLISKVPAVAVEYFSLDPDRNYYEDEKLIISSGWTDKCRSQQVDEIYVIDDNHKIGDLNVQYAKVASFGWYEVYKIP
ncbi:hypothetical protein [Paraglaciecola aquimarina]|uniref:hypothetical protein n=1 Tax=Paraglaciecola aquimarina TaxID=1235557 RepID=UPI003D162795